MVGVVLCVVVGIVVGRLVVVVVVGCLVVNISPVTILVMGVRPRVLWLVVAINVMLFMAMILVVIMSLIMLERSHFPGKLFRKDVTVMRPVSKTMSIILVIILMVILVFSRVSIMHGSEMM